MKTLFIGGIKSGKSYNAEKYTLELSKSKRKPVYLATTEFFDDEMRDRVAIHRLHRGEKFRTYEEALKIFDAIKVQESPVLVECLSMWINNMLYHQKSFDAMKDEIEQIMTLEQDIVFVFNDVGSSVVSTNKLVREFVDINGKLSQIVASKCDEVYHTIAGISTKIK